MDFTKKFGYKIDIERLCTHEEYAAGAYGSWSSSFSNTYEGIKKDNKYPDVVSSVDLEVLGTKKAYLVWCEYSTGDSFGDSYCGGTESIALVLDRNVANEIENKILLNKKEYTLKFTN